MALSEEKIVFTMSKDDLSYSATGSGSAAIGLEFVKKRIAKEIAKKIVGSALGVTVITAFASGILAALTHFSGNNGIEVSLTLTPKTVTKIQQGKKYTFEKFDLTDVSISFY